MPQQAVLCEADVTDGQSTWFVLFFLFCVRTRQHILINALLQPCCTRPQLTWPRQAAQMTACGLESVWHALVSMETLQFQLIGCTLLFLGFKWNITSPPRKKPNKTHIQSLWSQHQSHWLAGFFDSAPWVWRIVLRERHFVRRVVVPLQIWFGEEEKKVSLVCSRSKLSGPAYVEKQKKQAKEGWDVCYWMSPPSLLQQH